MRLRGCIKPTGRLERQIVRHLLFWLCRDRLLRLFARCVFDTPNVEGVEVLHLTLGVRPLPASEVEVDGHRVTNLVAIDLVNTILRELERHGLRVLAFRLGLNYQFSFAELVRHLFDLPDFEDLTRCTQLIAHFLIDFKG